MNARQQWRSFAKRVNARGARQVGRACAALGSKRKLWVEAGPRIGGGSLGRIRRAGHAWDGRRRAHLRGLNKWKKGRQVLAPLAPAQRRTLDVGSWVVLSGLGFGFQLGGWPVWTMLAGIGGYAIWVVLYAEITIQMSRGRLSTESLSASMPDPEPEEPPA